MRAIAVAFCLLFVVACSTEEPVTEADKTVVLRAAELSRFGYRFENIEALETFTKKRHLDGTSEIEYHFQSPPGAKVLFLHVSVKLAKNESDAAFTQGAEKVGLMIGFKKSGVEERELPAPPSGKLSLLVKTFLLVVSGLYFDDPALWQKVIEPSMSRFRAYQAL
jgi:hypothetical protein